MKLATTLSLTLTAVVFLTGCDTGPIGPEGPPGNANVFAFNRTFSMADASFSGSVAAVQFNEPAITPSVVDNGAVLAYFREQDTWTAMPYTFGEESPDLPAVDFTITLGFAHDDGFLELFYEASSPEITLENQPDRLVKIVVIDGFPFGKNGPDLSDYEAVKAYYGLTD
ncbi:MAG: hypothetical protein AAGI71_16415 [Bacteroidota bacterium]